MNEKKKKRLKPGIFHKLIVSYLLFAVLMVVTFAIVMVLSVRGITGESAAASNPFNIVDEQGELQNLKMVESMHGWVEILNEDYAVQKVYGQKETSAESYSQGDIYALLRTDSAEEVPYVGQVFEGKYEGNNVYYLVQYPRDVVSVKPTLLLSNRNALSGQANRFLMLFLAAFLLECLGLSYYLARKIKRPLGKILEGMEKIQSGDREVRLDFKTEAEFEEIRDTFNMMVETMERQQREKAELEEKKSRMLLELSHDIRTPVATIKSYASALLAGVAAEEKKKEYYENIDRKADRVSKLSEDMFMLLKVEDSEYRLEKEKLDLCEMLRQIVAEYYDEIAEAGLELETEIPEEKLWIWADKNLLNRVIAELVTNAVKYNKKGNFLKVCVENQVENEEHVVKISLMDDGEAIDEKLRETLFDIFSTGDAARRSSGGTGIGLSIVKAIVEKHGGQVSYERDGMCFKCGLHKNSR